MKKKKIKQSLAVMLALLMAINSFSGSGFCKVLVSYADTVRPAIVNATSLNVRSGPGTSYGIAGKLTNGNSVNVIGETTGTDRKVWYQIEYGGGKKGYVLSTYLKFPVSYSNDMNFENYLNSQGFPESYKPGLRQLHAEYPNWVFKAQHTNLDWEDVISNESVVGRNLVHSSSDSSWKSTAQGAYDWNSSTWPGLDSSSYVAASEGIIRYYMDPRNFLDDKYVFQFLVHSYNASAQTADGLRSMVQNTFLSGNTNVSGTIDWSGATGNGGNTGPGGGTSSSGGASQTGPGSSTGSGGTSSPGGASQTGPGSSTGGGTSSSGGASLTGPGSGGTSSSGGASQTGPGSSTGTGGTSSSGGACLTGPGSSVGSGGTLSTGGASLTGPGSSVGSGGTSSNGGVSLIGPGSSVWNGGTSSTGGANLTGPGSSAGNKGTSTSGGVSLTAPGTTTGGNQNNSSGRVSLTAPGTQTSSIKNTSAFITKKETNRVTTPISPGMTTGPGGSTANSGGNTTDPGGQSNSNGPGAGSYGTDPGTGSYGSDPGTGSIGGPGSNNWSAGNSSGTASYVNIIMNAGAQSGVNPYVLAAMIIQEQGTNGTGRCISGTVAGYVGYYNFFNIEAYQSGSMDAVSRGLWYASQSGSYGRPWNSVDKSILGGALYYGTNYVNAGQDTFYLKKFNVQGSNLYKHQYMTNIQGAASEGAKLAEAYGSQVKQSALEFKIPVYLNMPATACVKPEGNGSPNNKLSGLGVEGFTITPTFSSDITSYNLIVSPSVSSVTVNAVPLASTASISGAGTIQLQSGNNEIMVSVTAQNGTVRNYVIHVVRQDNGPAYNSALGAGVSGGSSANSPGPGYSGNEPGSGSSGQGGGPAYNSVPSGPGSSNTSGTDPGYGSGSSSGTGPGSSYNTVTPNNGPGSSGGNYDTNTIGPGGSNVTIVR